MFVRVGILGGTFNPVHLGHVRLAEGALEEIPLDEVVWVPALVPPHKAIEGEVTPEDRAQMVQLAIQGNGRFRLSRVELTRPPPSYTVDTAGSLKAESKDPQAQWYFLVGADDAQELSTWKDFEKLLQEVQFVVIPRPGFALGSLREGVQVIQVETPDISSSEVRRRVREGKSIEGLVPEAVGRYIQEHKLYR